MKIIDLHITHKYKVKKDIEKICGGQSQEYKLLNGFNKGLGGFIFIDQHSSNDSMMYKATIAFYDKGLGLYCRNFYKNFLTLIPENELTAIHIFKYPDIIRPARFSLYSWLLKSGRPHEMAEQYLMPIEILEEHIPQTVIQAGNQEIFLSMDHIGIRKMKNIFGKTKYRDFLSWDISPSIIRY